MQDDTTIAHKYEQDLGSPEVFNLFGSSLLDKIFSWMNEK